MTGRKRDEFAWGQVEEIDKGWICKHCREKYGGGVDKIKRHLAGAGQISKCAKVPQDIADEARRRLPYGKRKFENNDDADPSDQETMRNSAVVASTVAPPVQIPSSSTATTSLPSVLTTTSVEGSENIDCVDGSVSNLGGQSAPQEVCDNAIDVAPTVAPLVQIPSSSTPTTSLDCLQFSLSPYFTVDDLFQLSPSPYFTVEERDSMYITDTIDLVGGMSVANPSGEQEISNNTNDVDPTSISISLGLESNIASASNEKCGPSPTLKCQSIVPSSSQNDQDHHKEEENSMSWNATGCTLMVYNLNQQNEGEKSERTLGFYSAKGFLFAKAPDVLSIENVRDVFRDLTSNKGTVMHFMGHGKYGGSPTDQGCDLRDHWSNSNWTDDDPGFAPKKCSCLGHEIERTCLDICMESVWAWDLINKAEQVHQLLGQLYESKWYYKTLERGGFKELPSGDRENHISRFLSIIVLENDLRKRVSVLKSFINPVDEKEKERGISSPLMELEKILQDSTFWEDGRELKRALSPILKIPYLIDTLVPAAGYIEMYMKAAKQIIVNIKETDKRPKKDEFFWHRLDMYLVDTYYIARRRPIATYLNPANLWYEDANTIHQLKRTVEARLPNLVGKSEFVAIATELELYGDRCRSPFKADYMTLKSHHPIKLWQQYGSALPLLRNLAIQELSQPVSCMSNQVKKHMNECKAAEGDFFQNLNLRMSNEFRDMGDDIYKPVDFSLLEVVKSANAGFHAQAR